MTFFLIHVYVELGWLNLFHIQCYFPCIFHRKTAAKKLPAQLMYDISRIEELFLSLSCEGGKLVVRTTCNSLAFVQSYCPRILQSIRQLQIFAELLRCYPAANVRQPFPIKGRPVCTIIRVYPEFRQRRPCHHNFGFGCDSP